MDESLALQFEEITADDIQPLTRLMINAFDADYRRHSGSDQACPEPFASGDFFRRWLVGCSDVGRYKICTKEALIGGIVVWLFEDERNILGSIFVDPAYQGHAVGQRAWQFVEATYPTTRRWTLSTPRWSTKNHFFYEQRCGFHKVREERTTVVYAKDFEE